MNFLFLVLFLKLLRRKTTKKKDEENNSRQKEIDKGNRQRKLTKEKKMFV